MAWSAWLNHDRAPSDAKAVEVVIAEFTFGPQLGGQ